MKREHGAAASAIASLARRAASVSPQILIALLIVLAFVIVLTRGTSLSVLRRLWP